MFPKVVTWMVRCLAPSQRADTVLADLERDYAAMNRQPGKRWWLARETVSLVVAYSRVRLRAVPRRLPILIRDVQLVARGIRRGGGALIPAAVLLAVGLGALLITAGLVQALLLRHVSATHGDRLRRVVAVDRMGSPTTRFSFVELQVIREHIADAGEVGAVYLQPVLLRVDDVDLQTMAEIVDGSYFELTGMSTVIGRGLLSVDDRHEAPPVAVLAEPFWRRHFAASPQVLGAVVRLNGAAYTVIGIARTLGSSSFFGASVDAWVAAAHADALLNTGWRTNVRDRWFTPFVLPAHDTQAVESQLSLAATVLGQMHVDPWRDRKLRTTDGTVLVGGERGAARVLALVFGGLAALILLAAGSNVGGVLIARAAVNQRTAAIHVSMGAGRSSVVRRQVIEGGLVGLLAGILALVLYVWVRTQLAEVAVLPTLALRLDLPLSARVIVLAIGSGVAAGMALAVGPALWSTRVEVAHALRDGNSRGGGPRTVAVRRALVSLQVCLSLVLVVGAALFVRSLDALANANLGFSGDQLVAMDFDVEPVVPVAGDLPLLAREALSRVNALPDVVAAAMSNRAPVDQSTPAVELQIAGDDTSRLGDVTMNLATERYFETVGVSLLHGRSFTADEVANATDVVIVNRTLADRFWPGADPLHRAVYLPIEARTLRVVGVARDAKYRRLTDSDRPHIYRPSPPGLGLTLLARTRTSPRETLRSMQRELDRVGPGVVGFFPRTLADHLAVQLLPTRAAARAASVLGVLALALSALALYALVAWVVTLRRREISVRMALGASARDVRWLVVRQSLSAATPGLIVGVGLAGALGALARSALYGVSPTDPTAFAVGIGALLAIVLLAGYLPSRAATAIDPATTLRH